LLERVVDHLLQHGIAQFSLRSAGELIGVSARMLVHHFGSKEQLLSEALAMVRTRQVEHLAPSRVMPISAFDEVFRESWRTLAAPDFRRYFLLNHELLALALRDTRRYQSFLNRTTEEWRGGLPSFRWRAVLARGGQRQLHDGGRPGGLPLDLAVTRDRERVDGALDLVAQKPGGRPERHAATVGLTVVPPPIDHRADGEPERYGQGGTLPVVNVLFRQQLPAPASTTSFPLPEITLRTIELPLDVASSSMPETGLSTSSL
jgi:AcrR family transcriptional regulator